VVQIVHNAHPGNCQGLSVIRYEKEFGRHEKEYGFRKDQPFKDPLVEGTIPTWRGSISIA
jgi:hypothetical protein